MKFKEINEDVTSKDAKRARIQYKQVDVLRRALNNYLNKSYISFDSIEKVTALDNDLRNEALMFKERMKKEQHEV